jgi:ubiquinone/menaquinone biosynthesis C-methylase UbiE
VKDWDAHVTQAAGTDVVVDVGAGTGLLSLALADSVREVWAIDIAPSMTEYLKVKATSAGLQNVRVAVSSADSLPLVDGCADLVVSNYCFHHLPDPGKRLALAEAHRVLKPGGRLVFGDMMFGLALGDARDREVVSAKVRAIARRGPSGVLRIARNAGRIAAGRWEHPARGPWWERAMAEAGFIDVAVDVLDHEGGLAYGRRP